MIDDMELVRLRQKEEDEKREIEMGEFDHNKVGEKADSKGDIENFVNSHLTHMFSIKHDTASFLNRARGGEGLLRLMYFCPDAAARHTKSATTQDIRCQDFSNYHLFPHFFSRGRGRIYSIVLLDSFWIVYVCVCVCACCVCLTMSCRTNKTFSILIELKIFNKRQRPCAEQVSRFLTCLRSGS